MAIFRAIFGKCGYFWELFSIKKIFGYILVWWLFCGYFSIFLKIKKFNGYLAILWLFFKHSNILSVHQQTLKLISLNSCSKKYTSSNQKKVHFLFEN